MVRKFNEEIINPEEYLDGSVVGDFKTVKGEFGIETIRPSSINEIESNQVIENNYKYKETIIDYVIKKHISRTKKTNIRP